MVVVALDCGGLLVADGIEEVLGPWPRTAADWSQGGTLVVGALRRLLVAAQRTVVPKLLRRPEDFLPLFVGQSPACAPPCSSGALPAAHPLWTPQCFQCPPPVT